MNLASKICTGKPLFVLQHRAGAITGRDLDDLNSESHICGVATMLLFCCWLKSKLHARFSDWQTALGSTWEARHEVGGSATVSMEHLDLIGTSQDGLDHPEEIHGIDGNGTERPKQTCWAWKS
ncbi:hypothetical protein D8674_006034 [Pyrus ussuriensis x Pyrus communis]|uniref:Uncharacterized protein n=1 Tax=Pyrus ussuriensis x Pyrus communis TaxID=2448454 RepID=A0A5N5FTU0_9ROSA|nr:hypothetical protein D8674_006034 [Pyrus ussuriensis x Pyrus communis]